MVFWIFFFLVAFSQLVNGRRRIDSNHISSIHEDHYIFNHSFSRKLEKITPSAHRVDKLPLFQGNMPINYAGHLYVDGDHSAHFYWLFEKPTQPENAPIIIWMNGGPGCSSMDGLFIELGPFKFENHKLVLNEQSWHKVGNLLFIDQPVGTGLSFTTKAKYPKTDLEVNIHLYKMLLEFLTLHDNYLKEDSNGKKISREIYLTGESHAGHYIPSVAKYILEQNENSNIHIKIAGLAIGNGWMDPYNQYDVSDFMHSLGILSLGQKFHLKQREKSCQGLIKKGTLRSNICLSLLDDVLASTGNSVTGKIIMYDARISSRTSAYPPGHEEVESYLNKKDVRSALHVLAPQKYQECTDPPYFALSHQDAKGVTSELTYLLNLEMPILLYSGQFDIICNHLGVEKMLNKLLWNGRADWLRSTTGVWAVNNNPAGFIRKAKNLQYLIVSNAGHMVPLSKPVESFDMIDRFINKKQFAITGTKTTIPSTMPPGELISNEESSSSIQIPRVGLRNHLHRVLFPSNQSIPEIQLSIKLSSLSIPSSQIIQSSERLQLQTRYSAYLLDLFQLEFNLIVEQQFPSIEKLEIRSYSLDLMTKRAGSMHEEENTNENEAGGTAVCSMVINLVLKFSSTSQDEFNQFKELVKTNSLLVHLENDLLNTFLVSKIDPYGIIMLKE